MAHGKTDIAEIMVARIGILITDGEFWTTFSVASSTKLWEKE